MNVFYSKSEEKNRIRLKKAIFIVNGIAGVTLSRSINTKKPPDHCDQEA
jgi:hypothetical protein